MTESLRGEEREFYKMRDEQMDMEFIMQVAMEPASKGQQYGLRFFLGKINMLLL